MVKANSLTKRQWFLLSALAVVGLTAFTTSAVSQAPVAVDQVPRGTVLPFAGAVPPPGFLLCDGTELAISAYPRLYAAIGTSWGAASSATFTLPDLRGRFLRGVDEGAGNDPNSTSRIAINPGGNVGDEVGSLQSDGRRGFSGTFSGTTSTAGSHSHTFNTYNDDYDEDDGNSSIHNDGWADDRPNTSSPTSNPVSTAGSHTHDFNLSVSFTGDAETRPKNAYVHFIIKY